MRGLLKLITACQLDMLGNCGDEVTLILLYGFIGAIWTMLVS